MKFCIPTAIDDGIDSVAYGHFASAPYFIVYDTKSKELYSIQNENAQYEEGISNPAKLMKEHQVTAILVGGMGAKSIKYFADEGIKVFRSSTFFRVYELINQFEKDLLFELNHQDICKEYNCVHYS